VGFLMFLKVTVYNASSPKGWADTRYAAFAGVGRTRKSSQSEMFPQVPVEQPVHFCVQKGISGTRSTVVPEILEATTRNTSSGEAGMTTAEFEFDGLGLSSFLVSLLFVS